MDKKDWALLIIPIIFNGVIIYIFQKVLSSKLDKIKKRNKLRDDVMLLALKELQELNNIMIDENIKVQAKTETLRNALLRIKNKVVDIIKFFDTNEYDLSELSKEYSKWEFSWEDFSKKILSVQNSNKLSEDDSIELGRKLEKFKKENQNLIKTIREKY